MFQNENDVLRKTNETFLKNLGIIYVAIFISYIAEYFKGGISFQLMSCTI